MILSMDCVFGHHMQSSFCRPGLWELDGEYRSITIIEKIRAAA